MKVFSGKDFDDPDGGVALCVWVAALIPSNGPTYQILTCTTLLVIVIVIVIVIVMGE